mmetsp:Transcript_5348/g.8132  ORF Transcript_5348/g.8132 Transcript_5348/m.8132 type:complete len:91 (+) Transcript_5348:287-559(+)
MVILTAAIQTMVHFRASRTMEKSVTKTSLKQTRSNRGWKKAENQTNIALLSAFQEQKEKGKKSLFKITCVRKHKMKEILIKNAHVMCARK